MPVMKACLHSLLIALMFWLPVSQAAALCCPAPMTPQAQTDSLPMTQTTAGMPMAHCAGMMDNSLSQDDASENPDLTLTISTPAEHDSGCQSHCANASALPISLSLMPLPALPVTAPPTLVSQTLLRPPQRLLRPPRNA